MRHLTTQNSALVGKRAAWPGTFALACDDKNQSAPLRMAADDKTNERRMRLIKGHSVKINARLRLQFALGEFAIGFGIHRH